MSFLLGFGGLGEPIDDDPSLELPLILGGEGDTPSPSEDSGIPCSASSSFSLSSSAIARRDLRVSARSSFILTVIAASYTSPIRVSASNSFTLSAKTSTKGPIYASASNSFKISQDLTLRHLHAYRVSASNSFRLSSVASSLNHAIHHVSAANSFSLRSSASNALEMSVAASNSFTLSTTSSQTRDLFASAVSDFSLHATPGSNNFWQLDASSTAEFFASATAIVTGELAESRFSLGCRAFATVEFPWRRQALTLPPGGGLPHS